MEYYFKNEQYIVEYLVFIDIKEAQLLYGKGADVTGLRLKLNDLFLLIRLIITIPAIKPIIPAIIIPLDISINLIF